MVSRARDLLERIGGLSSLQVWNVANAFEGDEGYRVQAQANAVTAPTSGTAPRPAPESLELEVRKVVVGSEPAAERLQLLRRRTEISPARRRDLDYAAGRHVTVTEPTVAGFAASFSGCTDIVLASPQPTVPVCTITNTADQAPLLPAGTQGGRRLDGAAERLQLLIGGRTSRPRPTAATGRFPARRSGHRGPGSGIQDQLLGLHRHRHRGSAVDRPGVHDHETPQIAGAVPARQLRQVRRQLRGRHVRRDVRLLQPNPDRGGDDRSRSRERGGPGALPRAADHVSTRGRLRLVHDLRASRPERASPGRSPTGRHTGPGDHQRARSRRRATR